jgi:2-oxo-4-hydroxy-4-carboxy--5-ureidoimidazoline (OHCU) decarboxylase
MKARAGPPTSRSQLYRDRFGYHFRDRPREHDGEQLLMRIRIRLGHDEAAELRKSRWEHGNVVCRRLQRLASSTASKPEAPPFGAQPLPG